MENYDYNKFDQDNFGHDEPGLTEMTNNSPAQPSLIDPSEFPPEFETLFNEAHPTPTEEEIVIDDADLRKIEEWYETTKRAVENLKQECLAQHKQCQEKKQEIKQYKNLPFSDDCKNNIETIYQNIENEVCEDIKSCSIKISQNIRNNKNTAQIFLKKLKEDANILSLQFEYINITEDFSKTYSDWKRDEKTLKDVAEKIQRFPAIREKRWQEVQRKREEKKIIEDIEDIIYQQNNTAI